MEKDAPKVVRIHDVKIDKEYAHWLGEVKARYRSAQIKAAVKVNAEQLRFNWQLGRDLVVRKAEEKWGAGIVEQVSLDLQAAFPEAKGFSVSNLWFMKKWYLFYAGSTEKLYQVGSELQSLDKLPPEKLQQLVRELQRTDNHTIKKLHQLSREIEPPDSDFLEGIDFPPLFALVPWGHHIAILTKSESLDEALFYVVNTATEGWSRSTLMNSIKADLYHTSGDAITNFSETLPTPQSDLAQAITKDTYDFGFLTLKKGYEEEDLESELEKHLTRFLLELGTGFAYLGRQKQIIVAGKTRRLDMLFFHIPLNCYIVVELKAVPFQPEFAGKLNFYVNAVDDLIKTPSQNPSIGLLICSSKDKTEVQYSFHGIQTPMGVASYDNVQVKKIQDLLPSIEELKNRIRLLEEK